MFSLHMHAVMCIVAWARRGFSRDRATSRGYTLDDFSLAGEVVVYKNVFDCGVIVEVYFASFLRT